MGSLGDAYPLLATPLLLPELMPSCSDLEEPFISRVSPTTTLSLAKISFHS